MQTWKSVGIRKVFGWRSLGVHPSERCKSDCFLGLPKKAERKVPSSSSSPFSPIRFLGSNAKLRHSKLTEACFCPTSKIFISYSHADQAWAAKVADPQSSQM